ncbi:MAG: TRAP transporter substrate-binding protein [Spirochaetes bacterium]|nr:TRAP transporter substrate-binding protein [Spirochaetota bacterium]
MKRLFSIRFFTLLFFAASCVFASVSFAQVNIRFATFFPPTHGNSIIVDEWGAEIAKKTAGRVKVTNYTGGTLSPAPQSYDAVVQGVADATNTVLGYTMGKFPLTEVLDYPLGYAQGGRVATALAIAYYNKFKPKEFDQVKMIYLHGHGQGIFHSKRPVRKLEDLKGMKVRTYGPNADFMKLLGAVPVAMPMGEAYDALSKGVAEGILCPYEALEGWKFGEVLKYSTEDLLTAYSATFVMCMNKDKWASIPRKDQRIIERINKQYSKKQGDLWDKIILSGKNFILKRGNEIIKLSWEEQLRWEKAAEPVYGKYVANMKEKGLPGAEVLKFCRDYLKKNQKFI